MGVFLDPPHNEAPKRANARQPLRPSAETRDRQTDACQQMLAKRKTLWHMSLTVRSAAHVAETWPRG